MDYSVVTGSAHDLPREPVPRRPKESVEPCTFSYWDGDLHTTRVHGYGFRRVCECGGVSKRCASYRVAQFAPIEHKDGCRG